MSAFYFAIEIFIAILPRVTIFIAREGSSLAKAVYPELSQRLLGPRVLSAQWNLKHMEESGIQKNEAQS